MNRFALPVSVFAAIAMVAPVLADEAPPVFSKTPFAAARESTKGNAKILIVKATAAWCGPCKAMDKTTWRDEKVVAWVKDNGLAIQLDVDKEPKIAQELSIEAMPTMVAFKDGAELSRVVGFKKPADLLSWLGDVKAGKKSGDAVDAKLKAAKHAQPGAKIDIEERLELARELVQNRKYAEATEQYAWLWDNMVGQESSMVGVRMSFMAGDMAQLVAKHAPAKIAFAKLRDDAEAKLRGENNSRDDLTDWIVLNRVIDDNARTLAWFDRVKGDPEGQKAINDLSYILDELLISNGRLADYGRTMRDPVAIVRRETEMRKMIEGHEPPGDAAQNGQFKELQANLFRQKIATIYSAVLAADRKEDAAAAAAEAIKSDSSGALKRALVEAALRVDRAQPEHAAWLLEAAKAGESVQSLQEELKNKLGK